MSNIAYIAATGPGIGRSVVVLAVEELLGRSGRQIGCFRPVVDGAPAQDRLIALGPVQQGLNKRVSDQSCGCTVTGIVNTVAITAIQAHSEGAAP